MTSENTLLIEIGTEDLPPTRLDKLCQSLQQEIAQRFTVQNIPYRLGKCFAAPRRLAVTFLEVPAVQPNFKQQKRGPQLNAAFKNGAPTPAALGFAKSCGVSIEHLTTLEAPEGAWLLFEQEVTGAALAELLGEIVSQSIEKLSYPKKMRWGAGDTLFIRPIHWIAIVHGDTPIRTNILGVMSDEYTYGHRAHHPEKLNIHHADAYLSILQQAKVIADYDVRKQMIVEGANNLAQQINGKAVIEADLLDQVTGLVEWPVPMLAAFDAEFLSVPKEALISSMQNHQKCFPITQHDKLLPYFILVSNCASQNPSLIIHGNERVMRARLEDAKFFFEQDAQTSLQSKNERLKEMVYQKRLGSLYQKTQRVAKMAEEIAPLLNAHTAHAKRAAILSKADLVTQMVFEFPELQGIMGYYYAKMDTEADEVALALKEIYLPGHAKDLLPSNPVSTCLALCERLDTLVGIFGIGLVPTGDKDPYALKRAAMGILRILIEKQLPLNLENLLTLARNGFGSLIEPEVLLDVQKFCMERLRAWYQEQGVSAQVIEAVFAVNAAEPYDIHRRIQAVHHFIELPQAQALANANKRVKNILHKNNLSVHWQHLTPICVDLLQEPAEKALFDAVHQQQVSTAPMIEQGDFQNALTLLAALKEPLDLFFDQVLVMAEDDKVKENRLLLLSHVYALFMQIADISKLAI